MSLPFPAAGEFPRYFLASLAALLIDIGLLHAAAQVVHYLVAATLAYAAGAVLLYLLAIRWVFGQRRHEARQPFEFSVFAAIGLGGLLLNDLVIWAAVAALGSGLLVAKLCAAGASFLFNFALRRHLLFR